MPTAPAFATAATSSTVVTPGIAATWIGADAPTSFVNRVSIMRGPQPILIVGCARSEDEAGRSAATRGACAIISAIATARKP